MDSPFKKKTLKTAADYTIYCGSHFGLTTLLYVWLLIYVTPLLSYFIIVSWTSSKSYSIKYTLYCRICMIEKLQNITSTHIFPSANHQHY